MFTSIWMCKLLTVSESFQIGQVNCFSSSHPTIVKTVVFIDFFLLCKAAELVRFQYGNLTIHLANFQ